MLKLHPTRCFRDALRLICFQRERFGGVNGAESAGACAAIACDHESRRAFAPAFPMVRAFGAFANGMKPQILKEVARLEKSPRSRQLDAQPFRQSRSGTRRLVAV